MKENKSGIIKAIFSVTTIVLIVKIFGFIKQIVTAFYFGTTIETDLIALSQGLIGDFDFFITHALVTALTAVYIKNKEDEKESRSIVSGIFKIFIPVSLLFVVVFFFGSSLFAKLIAPTYDGDLKTKLSYYIKIFSPFIIFQTIIAISSAVLTANKKFLWQQLVGFNQSILVISFILLFEEQLGIWSIVIGFCSAIVFNVIFTGIPAKKYWSFSFRKNPFKNSNVLSVLKMMLPLLIGYAMIYINQIADKIISSGLEEGCVTALNYSGVLLNLILTFVTSILSVLFVYITYSISKNKHDSAKDLVTNSMTLLVVVFLPISLLLCLFSKEIVTIVYMRGSFDEYAVILTSQALLGYGICIVPYCIKELFARYLYGYEDSKHPMINSCIGIIINIITSIILSHYVGILGIAIGSSLADIVCAMLNFIVVKRKTNLHLFKTLFKATPFFGAEIIICVSTFVINKFVLTNTYIWIRALLIVIGFAFSIIISLPLLLKIIRKIRKEKNQEEVTLI